MELDTLVQKLQSKLLLNEEMLENVDAKRNELDAICKEELTKISSATGQVKEKLEAAESALKRKVKVAFTDIAKDLGKRREQVRTDSLLLIPELEMITELTGKGEESKFDTEDCLDRVREVINRPVHSDGLHALLPLFNPSSTLASVKASDLGYLCMAKFHPSQFELFLSSPVSSLQIDPSINMSKVVCIIKTDQMFSNSIQANIKFSIKNKDCKQPVPYSKEDCKLSEDKQSFQISFLAYNSGMYIMTVLLYDQHITNSPLNLPITLKQQSAPKDYATNNLEGGLFSAVSSLKKQIHQPTCDVNRNLISEEPTAGLVPSPDSRQVTLPLSKMSSTNLSPLSPPSGPLDLQLLSSSGQLVGQRRLCLPAGGSKPGSVSKPIGMCVLLNKKIVVSSTFDDTVKMFSPSGQFITQVSTPKAPFTRPTDMVTLHSGQFAVRDDNKVMVFSCDGQYMRTLWEDKGQVRCYGLAQDKEDRLVTIMETRRPRKTDLLFFDINTGKLSRKIEMEDIISDKIKSKCRFLTYQLDRLYITDLGLDCVYILDPATISVKVFGSSGSEPGKLSDPAGLVVDSVGNMVVADSRNHRLCLFNQDGKFVSNVSLNPETRRPSGVVLDNYNRELYVLNLQGKDAMIKYRLK